MYNIAKYKQYFKVKFFLTRFSSPRILKFKAAKWKTVQEYIKINHTDLLYFTKKFKKKKVDELTEKDLEKLQIPKDIFNPNLVVIESSVESLENYYKEGLNLKRSIFEYYDTAVKQVYFKKLLDKKQNSVSKILFCSLFIAPFFKLEILLRQLGLFKSVRQICLLLNTNKILVNEKAVCAGFSLSEGDIISFKDINIELLECIRIRFYTFIEIDFFSNKIIILKSYKTMSESDCALLFPSVVFDISKFVDYVKR